MQLVALTAVYLIIGAIIVWKGSGLLENSADSLSVYYNLTPTVHGAVVVAVGSSFPELSSTVIATLVHGEFELGLSAVVGSAIFNILVIPGVSALAGGGLRTERDLIFKDGQFYLLAVAALLLTLSLAVVYHPVEGAGLQGDLGRGLAVIPILLYLLYIFIQQQDTKETAPKADAPELRPLRAWGALLLSLVLILVGVELLVRGAINLGEIFGTPSFIWGLTVIAVVTSLPDTFVSVRLARAGKGVVSLANVLGSNIFDLLVAVPAGVLIAGATTVNFAVAAPLMAILTVATILLFAAMRTRLYLNRREAALLLGGYALFLLWVVLEGTGVTALI